VFRPFLRLAPTSLFSPLQQLDSSNLPTRTVLRFYGEEEGGLSPVELKIGETTSEDVLCDLGGAIRTFWKEDVRFVSFTSGSIQRSDPE
jgi:hypothetical protein